ncbi:MAG: zinc dependent phospholipase C family protein [Phycisphaerae bacterium]|nr:zinc dependent phospholipase C family protein [Phycisphaerae bacterium]
MRKVLIAAVIWVGCTSANAWAWGPATHVKLACDLLDQLHLLPAGVAVLLAAHRKHYLFGNVAADVVLAKRLSRVRQFCHHWETGFTILDDAKTPASRAFALGYLSHLAADSVAHAKFLPRQMTVTRTTMSLGHVYWELRADTTIGSYYWQILRDILKEVFEEHEASLSARLTDTLLPFSLNWRLFYRTNYLLSRQSTMRAIMRLSNVSRWRLSDQLLREYRTESLERMLDVVANLRSSAVLQNDPNGNVALAYTRMQRRQLRQMARAGLAASHLLREAETIHAPCISGILGTKPAKENLAVILEPMGTDGDKNTSKDIGIDTDIEWIHIR